MTEGCTWLLQNPSHLFTATSPSHVLCRRPNSSYSSVQQWIHEKIRKKNRNFSKKKPFMRCNWNGKVSQFSSPVCCPCTIVQKAPMITKVINELNMILFPNARTNNLRYGRTFIVFIPAYHITSSLATCGFYMLFTFSWIPLAFQIRQHQPVGILKANEQSNQWTQSAIWTDSSF